jgi:hypothetical protein
MDGGLGNSWMEGWKMAGIGVESADRRGLGYHDTPHPQTPHHTYQPEPTQEPSNESRSIVYRMYFIRFTSRSMAYTLR